MAKSAISVTTNRQALQRLDRQFSVEIPEAIKRNLREAMPKIGAQFVATAQQLVPYASGETHDAITYTIDSAGLAVNMFVDPAKMKPITMEGRSVPGIVRVYWLEFGTRHMTAQPFFFAAWRIHRRSVKARVKRAAKKGAQEALR